MAADGHINIDTKIDGSGFQTGLKKLGSMASETLGVMTKLIAGVGAALGGAAVAGVKYNAQMEQYVTSFGTMLGGADKAQGLISQLKKYAADTPFEFSDLAKGTQTLLAFGISSKDVMGDLQMLGDISQGNKERFDALSLAFAQMTSAGKLQGQDLLQMVNAGFNPLQVMVKTTGKSMAELRDEMQKGQISAQDVADAFKAATSKGGQFYGAMEAQSKTFSGQLSTLKDNASQFLGELTNGLENSLKDTALPMVNGWMEQLQKAFSTGGVNGVVGAFGSVLSQAVTAIAQQAPDIINLAVQLIQAFIQGIEKNSDQITSAAFKIIMALFRGIVQLAPQMISAAATIITGLVQGLSQHSGEIASMAVKLVVWIAESLLDGLPQIEKAAVQMFMGIVQAIPEILEYLSEALPQIIEYIAATFENIPIIGQPVAALLSFISDNFDILAGAAVAVAVAIAAYNATVAIQGIVTNGASIATKAAAAAQWLLNAAMDANPVGLIVAAIALLVTGIVILWNTNEGFRNAIIGAWNAIIGFFNGIPAWWSGLWTQVGQFFTDIWNSIISFFTTTVPAWIDSVGQWFQQLPYNIGLALGKAVRAVADFGVSVWNWVTTTLPQIINGIIQWYQQLPGRIWTFLAQVVTDIGNWGSNMWNYLSVETPKIISGIGNWFSQLPGRIWDFLLKVIENVGKWGSSMLSSATQAASNVVSGVIKFFSSLPDNMLNIGKNIITGLWNGITSGAGWLWNKVSGFCGDFVNGFKKGLGIHSPSRLFADEVGKFVPPGISVGMDKAMPGTIANMRAQISGMMEQARAAISAEQARVGASFGASVQYQVAMAGGYGTSSAPAYTGPSTVKTQINIDSREFATAVGPAISEQSGWEEDH